MREYDLQALDIFNELADWVYVRDLNPESDKHYWGNEAIRGAFRGGLTLEQFNAVDLRAITSPAMAEWNREAYQQVQVRGERVKKRRTIYPTGKAPHVMDYEYSPLHLRVPAGAEEGQKEVVKVLALVIGKHVILDDDAQKEANRAAMLFNFTNNAFILLPGAALDPPASATSAAAGGPEPARPSGEPDLPHRPALFTNLPARRCYAPRGGAEQQQQNPQPREISLARVLGTCSFESSEARQALQTQILSLGLRDSAIDLEADTPAHLREDGGGGGGGGAEGEGKETLPNLPLHRNIHFTPVTDPVSGLLSIMVTEHDVTDIKLALENLRLAREQVTASLMYTYVV